MKKNNNYVMRIKDTVTGKIFVSSCDTYCYYQNIKKKIIGNGRFLIINLEPSNATAISWHFLEQLM